MQPTMSLSQEPISGEFKLMATHGLEMTQVLDKDVYSKSERWEQGVHLARQRLQIITAINTEPGQVGGRQSLFGQGYKTGTVIDL